MNENHDDHRVVVTGLGAVTPLGASVDALWEGLLAGKVTVRRLGKFDVSGFNVQIASEVTDFNVGDYSEYIDKK